MKNAANCEMYYETQETTNHQIFERKWHWGVYSTGNYERAPYIKHLDLCNLAITHTRRRVCVELSSTLFRYIHSYDKKQIYA